MNSQPSLQSGALPSFPKGYSGQYPPSAQDCGLLICHLLLQRSIYFPEFLCEQNPAACTHCMGVTHHSDFGCVDQCAIPLRRLVFSFFFFLASILLYRVLLLYFPFDEHLECLEVWGIAIKTAVNIDTYVFGIIYTFKNLGYLGLIASICGRYIYTHTHTPLLHTIYTHKVAYMPYMHIHKVAIIFHILTNNFSDFLLFKELCDI